MEKTKRVKIITTLLLALIIILSLGGCVLANGYDDYADDIGNMTTDEYLSGVGENAYIPPTSDGKSEFEQMKDSNHAACADGNTGASDINTGYKVLARANVDANGGVIAFLNGKGDVQQVQMSAMDAAMLAYVVSQLSNNSFVGNGSGGIENDIADRILYETIIPSLGGVSSGAAANRNWNGWTGSGYGKRGQELFASASAYGTFMQEIQNNNGKAIDVTNDGNGTFTFSTFVEDTYNYNNSWDTNGTNQTMQITGITDQAGNPITNYTIVLENGTRINPGDSLMGKGITAGMSFTIETNDPNIIATKIEVDSKWNIFTGRMEYNDNANGKGQPRIVFNGQPGEKGNPGESEWQPQPQDEDVPIIVLYKYDAESGGELGNIGLTLTIDEAFSQSGASGMVVMFGELMESGAGLKGELSNIGLNNAYKFFTYGYDCGTEQGSSRSELDFPKIKSFVKSQVLAKLSAKVQGNARYQFWVSEVARCRCPHGYQHGQGNCIWIPYDPNTGTGGYWVGCGQHNPTECPEYQAAIAAANAAVVAFANQFPENTDMLKKWLEQGQFFQESFTQLFGTPKYNIPYGEIFPVDFAYSAYAFYKGAQGRGGIMIADLARIYTGDLKMQLTEQSGGGYLQWENEAVKTLTVRYKDGDVTNGNENEWPSNPDPYLSYTNDESEFVHKGTKSDPNCYDQTYDLTKLSAFNQPDDTLLIDFDKYSWSAGSQSPVSATFNIYMKATERNMSGNVTQIKSGTIRKSGSKIQITSKDFWETLGIDVISRWNGTIEVTLTETAPAAGHLQWKRPKKFKYEYEWGKIVKVEEVDGGGSKEIGNANDKEDAIVEEAQGIKLKLDAYNTPKDELIINLHKHGISNAMLTGVTFKFEISASNGNSTTVTKTTDGSGNIRITAEDLDQLEIDVINRWTGTIDVKITEVNNLPEYMKWWDPKTVTYKYDHGVITSISESECAGEDAIVESGQGTYVLDIDAYDTAKEAPQIIIHKNEIGGAALEGVVFDIHVDASPKCGSPVDLRGLRTNDAGEIILYAQDLDPLKIDVITRWTGTVTVTLHEVQAPDGYELMDDITVTIRYEHGVITSVSSDPAHNQTGTTPWSSYTDNIGNVETIRVAAITIEDRLANTLKIRKVDGDNKYQEYLTDARFDVTIVTTPLNSSRSQTRKLDNQWTDNKGYVDLTETVKAMVGNLGEYSGTIKVSMIENKAPGDYPIIKGKLEVILTYRNGYLLRVDYPNGDSLSEATLDVGDSEDGKNVTIAVKNNKTQPIYISKVDSVTGKALSNVDFKVSVSTSEIYKKDELTGKIDTQIYKTDDDGLIAITTETLKKLGITNHYNESLYILMEEIGTKTGYQTLDEVVYVRVDYKNGNIAYAEVISKNSDTISNDKNKKDRVICTVQDGLLKITVRNDRKLPDLVISKETLTNNVANTLTEAVFDITINGVSFRTNEKVSNGGFITIKSEELESKLGINAASKADLEVVITERSVVGAVLIPEVVTGTIHLEDGTFVGGEVSNAAHLSIVNKNASIIVKVLNDVKEPATIIISGIVWQELATTKGAGVLQDGLYTTASDSEYSDRLFEGIEVTLYQKVGNDLVFVEKVDGTNPTLTDTKGYYEFTGLENQGNYVVKFTYNGQEFEASYGQKDQITTVEKTCNGPFETTTACTNCKGEGIVTSDTTRVTCSMCSGRGTVVCDKVYGFRDQYGKVEGKTEVVDKKCTRCDGAGKIAVNNQAACSACSGSGKVTQKCTGTRSLKNLNGWTLGSGSLPASHTCANCGNRYTESRTGKNYTYSYECKTCGQEGMYYVCSEACGNSLKQKESTLRCDGDMKVNCNVCNGTGKFGEITTTMENCSTCFGTGIVKATVTTATTVNKVCRQCGKTYVEKSGEFRWYAVADCSVHGRAAERIDICSLDCLNKMGEAVKQGKVELKHNQTCDKCEGVGTIDTEIKSTCGVCQGLGYVETKAMCKHGSERPHTYFESSNTNTENEKISSKASEVTNERKALNKVFNEIGSYPANYIISTNNGVSIFADIMNGGYAGLSSGNAESIAIKDSLANGYNIAYLYQEIKDVYDKVREETNAYLETNKYIRNNDVNAYKAIYLNVANKYYRDSNGKLKDDEIFNKLQFIYDSRLDAYAGSYTKEGGIESKTSLDTYGEYRYVNLGLIARDKTDLTLDKDLYESTVSINGYDTTYKYDADLGTYKQYIYEEDYNYYGNPTHNVGDLKPDGIAKYDDDQIELYLKYKITVQNTTNTITKLTEVADYFDYRFGYKDIYTTSAKNEIAGLRVVRTDNQGNIKEVIADSLEDRNKQDKKAVVNTSSKYYSASQIGLAGTNEYRQMFVTFAQGQEPELIDNGEKIEIYVTIKLGKDEEAKIANSYDANKDAKDVLYDFMHGLDLNDNDNSNEIMSIFNYAEINGYKTLNEDGSEGGFLDADSKPGTFIVNDYDIARKEYSEAYKTRRENPERFAAALDELKEIRQDDAWGVLLQLENNPHNDNPNDPDNPTKYYRRTIHGNVWEAVTDKVHTSTNLYSDELLTYIENNGVKGIIVELIELEPIVNKNEGRQIVRARTVTGDNGSYTFKNFIAGDYVVRFTYGSAGNSNYTEDQNNMIKGISINEHTNANNDTFYGINGQYYQSTKANPDTDVVKYWYAKYAGDKENPKYEASSSYNEDGTKVVGDKNTARYSDAYDDVNTRIAQIEAPTAGSANPLRGENERAAVDSSWSWNYEWNGTENVQKTAEDKHIDPIDAYTSTMNIEIEYTKPQIDGNKEADYYRYAVEGVDFGLTPRAEADMTIDKYVSNVKLYLQDGTKQLDVDIDKDGKTTYKNDSMYNNIVIPTGETTIFKDGLLEVLFDEQLLNGTTLEITYTITTTNDGEPNTITYLYENKPENGNTKPIAIAYYIGNGEELVNLVSYEGDRKLDNHENPIVNHEAADKFKVQNAGYDLGVNVRTRATNIIDYVDPALNFIQTNKAGEAINRNWELTTVNEFNTTREGNSVIMAKYNTLIRAIGGETYVNYLDYLADLANGREGDKFNVTDANNKSNLYIPILPGERNVTTLTLSKVLETTSTGTNDYEYSNLIEIAKLENYAGKSVRMEGYDITGNTDKETSSIKKLEDITDPYIKTLGTSKSETISIHAPTGLSIAEEAQANLSIVLVVLIVFAAGVVLIKKFVLTPKTKE